MIAVNEGKDPAGHKQERKQADTFAELAESYMKRHAIPKKRSWRDDQNMLNHDLLPHLGQMKADRISKRDIIRVVDIVAGRGAAIRANRVLGLVRCIYNWAAAEDLLSVNPSLGIRKRGIETARDRILTDEELRIFWYGLDKGGITPAVRTILRLALLTGQRIGEVAGTAKDEINLEKALWEIPGSRTKNRKPHTVPLSPWALELFTAAMRAAGESPYVFPSPATSRPVTARAPSKALRRERERIGIDGMRVHDLRRTVASNMARMGIERVTVGKVLNHASVDGASITGRVYDRYSHDQEKRQALEAWARRLREIVEGREQTGNVVALRGSATG